MPWLRVDDALPEHPKSDVLWDAAGSWQVYAVACMAWRDLGCDCSRHLTDGEFTRARAHRKIRAPAKIVDHALAALVTAGFLTVEGDTFRYHDWADYQPTKDEVLAQRSGLSAKRAEAGRRGGLRSGEARSEQTRDASEANAKQNEANAKQNEANAKQTGSKQEAPSRTPPVPKEKKPPKPPLAGGRVSRKSKAEGDELPLEPLPFTIGAALGAVATGSGGLFVEPVGGEFHPSYPKRLTDLIRRIPDLAAWSRVGRWIASGELAWRKELNVEWILRPDTFVLARQWEERANYPTKSGAFLRPGARPPADDDNDDWVDQAAREYRNRPGYAIPGAQ